jgi:hypothetical protein
MQIATSTPQGSVAFDDRELEWVTPEVRAPARFVVVGILGRSWKQNESAAPLADPFLVGTKSCMRALLLSLPATMKALEFRARMHHKRPASLGHVCGLRETRLARTALRSPCSAGRKQLKPSHASITARIAQWKSR